MSIWNFLRAVLLLRNHFRELPWAKPAAGRAHAACHIFLAGLTAFPAKR